MKLFFARDYNDELELRSTHYIKGQTSTDENNVYSYKLLEIVYGTGCGIASHMPLDDDHYRMKHWIKVFSGEYP